MTTRVGPYDCMDMEEAAKYLGREPVKFRGQYNDLKIPHMRVVGRVWFLQDDLDQWLIAQKRNMDFHQTAAQNALARQQEWQQAQGGGK